LAIARASDPWAQADVVSIGLRSVYFSDVRVSVIIPALNEAESLPLVLQQIPSWVHEVLLVDGHSTDGTPEVARGICPDIRVIMQEGRGKGAALRTGLQACTGDIAVTLDADGSTDPAEIPAFVGALLSGADFVKGSRFIQGGGTADMTPIRFLGNLAFVVFTNLLFRSRFTDITYGYNAVWREYRSALALEIDGWPQEIISNIRAARSKLRVVEVASFEQPRFAGVAKLKTFSAGWAILKAIVREYFSPIRPVVRVSRSGQTIPVLPVEHMVLRPEDGPATDSNGVARSSEPVAPSTSRGDGHTSNGHLW
jgi:glycosyltransferase involved in cell wall biosynthesis